MTPVQAQAWLARELTRAGRSGQPTDRGFPPRENLVDKAPASVVAARDFYREGCSDWGSAWILRYDVDGEALYVAYAGTDGDAGWVELFTGDGTPLATASLDGERVTWEATDLARARVGSGARPAGPAPVRQRLVVLGASGGVGKELVKQAYARGYQVVAVTRPGTAVSLPPAVEHRVGVLTDPAFLREAVRGADAVASGLGLRLRGLAPWNRPEEPDFLTRFTPALIGSMRAEGVRRLVAVSAGGVGPSRALVPAVFRAMISSTALRYAYAELDVMERALLASGLDVCLCRPGGLSDGALTGKARMVERLSGPARISRADVAAWMLAQLGTTPFAHRAALIAVA